MSTLCTFRSAAIWVQIAYVALCATMMALIGTHVRAQPFSPETQQYFCEQNRGEYCTLFGLVLMEGNNIAKDEKLAVSYHQRACTLNHPRGCTLLGNALEAGRGVLFDRPLAVQAYDKSCRLGWARGCTALQLARQSPHAKPIATRGH
jgi:TPR repeat protein